MLVEPFWNYNRNYIETRYTSYKYIFINNGRLAENYSLTNYTIHYEVGDFKATHFACEMQCLAEKVSLRVWPILTFYLGC